MTRHYITNDRLEQYLVRANELAQSIDLNDAADLVNASQNNDPEAIKLITILGVEFLDVVA